MDLTLGCGGHARGLLEQSEPGGRLLGLDCDPEILEMARSALEPFGDRVVIRHGNFNNAAEIFEAYLGKADGVIMDLGVSSYQIDCRKRGFSIFKDGPLDLRMDPTQPRTGRALVNEGKKEDLLFAIGTLGFLGIGLPPPDPDWGNMVNEARRNIFVNPTAVIWPALAIATLVIGLNLFADGLREELTRYQK